MDDDIIYHHGIIPNHFRVLKSLPPRDPWSPLIFDSLCGFLFDGFTFLIYTNWKVNWNYLVPAWYLGGVSIPQWLFSHNSPTKETIKHTASTAARFHSFPCICRDGTVRLTEPAHGLSAHCGHLCQRGRWKSWLLHEPCCFRVCGWGCHLPTIYGNYMWFMNAVRVNMMRQMADGFVFHTCFFCPVPDKAGM